MIYHIIVGISMIANVASQSCDHGQTLRSEAGRPDFLPLKDNKLVLSLLSGSGSEVKLKQGNVLSLIPFMGLFQFFSLTMEVKGLRDFTFTLHRPLQDDIHVLGRPRDPDVWEMIKIGLAENPMIGNIESVSITCDKKSGEDGTFIRNIHLIGCPNTEVPDLPPPPLLPTAHPTAQPPTSQPPTTPPPPPPTEHPTAMTTTTQPTTEAEPACTPVDMSTDLEMTKKPKKASSVKPRQLLNGVPIAIKPRSKAQMNLAVTAGISLELHRVVIDMVGVESVIFKWRPTDRKAQTLRLPVVDGRVDISLDPAESRSVLWLKIQYMAEDGADVLLITRLQVLGCTEKEN